MKASLIQPQYAIIDNIAVFACESFYLSLSIRQTHIKANIWEYVGGNFQLMIV